MVSGNCVKTTSSSGVFQMCKLEVRMSLVKVMTNGEECVGMVFFQRKFCCMGSKYAEHARWRSWSWPVLSLLSSRTEGGNLRLEPTQYCVCVCVWVRCACLWLSELLDFQHIGLQVRKLGVRFMCDKLPTYGIIRATPPLFPVFLTEGNTFLTYSELNLFQTSPFY